MTQFLFEKMAADIAALAGPPTVHNLLEAVGTVRTGDAVAIPRGARAIQVVITGTGAVAATVKIYGTTSGLLPSPSKAVLLATITLSGTNSDAAGFTDEGPWPYLFADLTEISGTGAAVSVVVGV